jgi:PAS domain S-box
MGLEETGSAIKGEIDWETTFNCIPDLIAILDSRHRVVKVNQAMAKALGVTPKQCAGLACYQCVHNATSPPPFCPHLKTLKDGQEHIEEVHEEALGGDFIVSTTPIKDKTGTVIGSVHVARNITERKQMEKNIREYAKRLEKTTKQLQDTQAELLKYERFAAIGELATILGHDLRNPLAALKYAVYYLKKENSGNPDKKIQEMLSAIDRSVDHSEKIISDLLCYAGEIRLDLQENSLKAVIDASLQAAKIPSCITVSNRICDAFKIQADALELQHAFLNIVKNAVDAMPNGGLIEIGGRRKASKVAVSFTDSGIGISEECLPKIFSPCFTTKAQGMGFGLAIAKRIIDAHGGKISFKTAAGKGTTFTIDLPIRR